MLSPGELGTKEKDKPAFPLHCETGVLYNDHFTRLCSSSVRVSGWHRGPAYSQQYTQRDVSQESGEGGTGEHVCVCVCQAQLPVLVTAQ